MKLRLHQFLSKCGEFSSKGDVKKAIWDGDVTINDSILKNIAYEFNPAKRSVKYRGKELFLPSNDVYFLLNKPAGYICSRLNSQELELNKRSIYELFRNAVDSSVYETLVTVGRLDEAIESYKNAISTKVGYGEAYWSLANLKTFDFTETDINEIIHTRVGESPRVVYEN